MRLDHQGGDSEVSNRVLRPAGAAKKLNIGLSTLSQRSKRSGRVGHGDPPPTR
jgi:hypothetical protein